MHKFLTVLLTLAALVAAPALAASGLSSTTTPVEQGPVAVALGGAVSFGDR